MNSIQSLLITHFAGLSNVSASFDKKIETGKDRIAKKCPKANSKVKVSVLPYQARTIYVLEPLKTNDNTHILYFHGGAYLTNFSSFHWRFLFDLVKKTACSLTTPDYPLSPVYCYKDVYNMIYPLYKECVEKYGAENLIVMGDSAGGGLALALSQLAKKEGTPTPSQIILLSPWVDLSCSDPNMELLEKKDKMLKKESLLKAALSYSRGEPLDNHLLSPINGSLHEIGEISVYTGTHDVLNADAKQLKKKAEKENVPINYVEVPEMIHIWPVIGFTPEATKTRIQIFEQIKKNTINRLK